MVSAAAVHGASIDAAEVQKFDDLAATWWDTQGPMAPLHAINPVRIGWIRDRACARFDRRGADRRPLESLRLLDIGCGAGIASEPLARLGASVTGIDPSPAAIDLARWHAKEGDLAIDYRQTTAETMATDGASFDVVLALEVIEHAVDMPAFVATVSRLVHPGGLLVVTTLSRTVRAWMEAIVAAEYLLRWLPRGTHDWQRFVTPAELARELRGNGMSLLDLTGVGYDASREQFVLRRDPGVNYMLAAARR